MSFEKKKIQIDTLGEYLSEIRQSLGMQIKTVALKTGISDKFIESLEKGDFCKLPADVYSLGFLRQLAELYNIDAGQLIDQYKKEKSIFCHLQKKEDLTSKNKFKNIFSKIVITPKILSLAVGLLFVSITILYIVWQVMSLSKAPNLFVSEPSVGQVYKVSFVSVRGKTDVGAMVTVNDQPVFVDEQGEFKTQIGVNNGPKDVVVVAKNKFEKITKNTIGINVEIKSGKTDGGVELVLKFSDEVNIKVGLDNAVSSEQSFHKGDSKTFKAKEKIIISTNNAGATSAVLNGTEVGFLGRVNEELIDVPFFAENNPVNTN